MTMGAERLGVEIGERSVKLVRVRRRGRRIVGVDVLRRALAGPTTKHGSRREAIENALRQLVAEHRLAGKPVAACLSGQDVLVRRLVVPEMDRADILAALALECRRLVKFPIDEAEIRYEIVARAPRDRGTDLHVLVAVAQRRTLDELREALERSRLRPRRVTIAAVALRTLFARGPETRSDDVVACLDFGESTSHLMVLKGREIRFSRELGVGSAALTDVLLSAVVPGVGTVALTPEKAEALKRAHGIPLGAEGAGEAEGIPLSVLAVMFRPVLERLARELWNSFDYCNEQFYGEPVTRLVLLGGGSRLRNLSAYLSEILKIPVARADALAEVGFGEAGDPSAPEIAAGGASELGLGLALLGSEEIDFLSARSAALRFGLAHPMSRGLAIAGAAALVATVAATEVALLTEQSRIRSQRSNLTEMASLAEAVQKFRAARGEEARLHDLLGRLAGGERRWSDVLRDLSHAIGPEVRLTELEVLAVSPTAAPGTPPATVAPGEAARDPEREIRLSGLLRTDARRAEEILGELMQSLERSPSLGPVRLEGFQAASSSTSRFSLTARVWPMTGGS